MTKIYKIIDSQGRFSTGGVAPYFTKNGKIWKTKGHLTQHLQQTLPYYKRLKKTHPYESCKVVVYNVVEVIDEDSRESVNEWIKEKS